MNAISSSNSRKEVKTIITNGKLILSSGILDNGYIIIENGKITDIGQGQPPCFPRFYRSAHPRSRRR